MVRYPWSHMDVVGHRDYESDDGQHVGNLACTHASPTLPVFASLFASFFASLFCQSNGGRRGNELNKVGKWSRPRSLVEPWRSECVDHRFWCRIMQPLRHRCRIRRVNSSQEITDARVIPGSRKPGCLPELSKTYFSIILFYHKHKISMTIFIDADVT